MDLIIGYEPKTVKWEDFKSESMVQRKPRGIGTLNRLYQQLYHPRNSLNKIAQTIPFCSLAPKNKESYHRTKEDYYIWKETFILVDFDGIYFFAILFPHKRNNRLNRSIEIWAYPTMSGYDLDTIMMLVIRQFRKYIYKIV